MKISKLTLLLGGFSLALASLSAAAADTKSYPDKPVRLVVPYTPGGFNDTLARTASEYLTKAWDQSVVVENKPGGNTLIGNTTVAQAKPDGYTLLITPLPFSALPGLYGEKMPYDALKDFEPVIWAGSTQNILTVRADSQFKSVKELIDYAKANPSKLNYGSTGSGSSNHLSMELFLEMTDTKMTHIPYKGSAPAVTALLAGDIDVLFDNLPNVYPNISAGKLNALGATGTKRAPLLPDTPTVAEAGVPGYEVYVWFGMQAPAGTPDEIIKKVNAGMVDMLHEQSVIDKFNKQGVEIVASSPAEFKTLVNNEVKKWDGVIKRAGIKIE
ncbi:tripartite tricarboxylate transporter substrate binding protein [Pollutimonas harenae]|uniref:Tripartite tricarboxylate transporter substrate binding protein n=1 Tax=Pollutimonas harenae TaxID=657015 RepID=A0A853GPP4_9BURK|nr:tripartite tricarboxylate transporter substrate binding protein [Pollutimonas harenae]NYT84137.1 tripartite tricarboxylate transporter substrate binding protein [Pollutimonas harenae]TEA73446.1 tripartite tricarboxylate transporter substrate binding protein [Pollutimonas harenae]